MIGTETVGKLFVGGEWVEAASGATFDVVNTANRQTVATLPDGGREEMRRAIAAASAAAQEEWGTPTPAASGARIGFGWAMMLGTRTC